MALVDGVTMVSGNCFWGKHEGAQSGFLPKAAFMRRPVPPSSPWWKCSFSPFPPADPAAGTATDLLHGLPGAMSQARQLGQRDFCHFTHCPSSQKSLLDSESTKTYWDCHSRFFCRWFSIRNATSKWKESSRTNSDICFLSSQEVSPYTSLKSVAAFPCAHFTPPAVGMGLSQTETAGEQVGAIPSCPCNRILWTVRSAGCSHTFFTPGKEILSFHGFPGKTEVFAQIRNPGYDCTLQYSVIFISSITSGEI